MKICPTQQNFGSNTYKVIKPSKRMVDRITIGTSAMIATIILGCGYMVKDRDYYESRRSIMENKLFNMDFAEIDAMVERFNIENLEITPDENGKYSYRAKNGNFKEIYGNFQKSQTTENEIDGTFNRKGLFKEDNYKFSLRQMPRRDMFRNATFELTLSPTNNPEKVEEYSIYQDSKTHEVYINGREVQAQEARDSKIFSLIFLAVALASLGYMASEDVSKD